MTGAELKAWREAQGLTQKQAAERVGKTWRTLARWEAAEGADIPETAADMMRGKVTALAPKARAKAKERAPLPVIKQGADLLEIGQSAASAVDATAPPKWVRGARRPTAAERKDSRFQGPNVWVRDHVPPQVLPLSRRTLDATVYKFPSSGEGEHSLVLIYSKD